MYKNPEREREYCASTLLSIIVNLTDGPHSYCTDLAEIHKCMPQKYQLKRVAIPLVVHTNFFYSWQSTFNQENKLLIISTLFQIVS